MRRMEKAVANSDLRDSEPVASAGASFPPLFVLIAADAVKCVIGIKK